MKLLSVVIPCYNEEQTLEELVERVIAVDLDGIEKELLIVDDGSVDATPAIIEELARRHPEIRTRAHSRNRGKGAAVRTGFEIATGDVIVIQDADLEYDPGDYPALLKPITSGRADVVFGTRFRGEAPHRTIYYWHYVGNRFLTMLSNVLTNLNLTDMAVCYKMFRREVLDRIGLQEEGFGIDPELTAKVARQGVRIYEVGISYYGRTFEEGKKISWRDTPGFVLCILRYNLFG